MIKKLPITYNRQLSLGAVYYDPLVFMSYYRLFDDFLMITANKQRWLDDLGIPYHSLQLPKTPRRTPITRSQRFNRFVKDSPKRKYVLYSPLDPPYKINPLSFLMNSPTIAHAYENKRYFRDEFADLIRMPEYTIKYINELDKAAAYRDLREEFGVFVMQDDESSGSKGTFIVRNEDDYLKAVRALKKTYGRSIVVSKFIEGQQLSVQVCITKYGIFSAGLQKQLLSSKYLCNPDLVGRTNWCGGELGHDFPDFVQHQAREVATIIGSELSSHGYKGIFGVDLILSPENEIYVIEINARNTGYTFLLNDMQLKQGKIPFGLLHVLELGNYDYEVTDYDALPSTSRYKQPLSYMIINNPLTEDFVVKKYVKPGLYRIKGDELVFEKEAYSVDQLKGDDSLLLFSRFEEGQVVPSGMRIMKIIKQGKCMAKDDDLNAKSQHIVAVVKKHFELPE